MFINIWFWKFPPLNILNSIWCAAWIQFCADCFLWVYVMILYRLLRKLARAWQYGQCETIYISINGYLLLFWKVVPFRKGVSWQVEPMLRTKGPSAGAVVTPCLTFCQINANRVYAYNGNVHVAKATCLHNMHKLSAIFLLLCQVRELKGIRLYSCNILLHCTCIIN